MSDYVRIYNCNKSATVENDWYFTNAIETGFLKINNPLPTIVDLRNPDWKIADQRATGSCVGWATVDSCIRWHFTKIGLLLPTKKLSVRYIWMASKEQDEFNSRPSSFLENAGTSIKAALDIVRKYGCVEEIILPFNGASLSQESENNFYALASTYRILNYFNLRITNEDGIIVKTKVEKWKEWLAGGNGPIIVRLNKDIHFENANKENPNLDHYALHPSKLGHAAAIVGYIDNRFIVRNSYGKTWGDDGFAYASIEYAEAAFDEAYGVCVR